MHIIIVAFVLIQPTSTKVNNFKAPEFIENTGAHIRTGQKTFFLHKWTGQKIGADWTSQTKQKRQKWTSHSYFWPVLICAPVCNLTPSQTCNLTPPSDF